MNLALTFATPVLLIGAIAAAIPFLLHLLATVRAKREYFPTLRLLRLSMDKTVRRRRVQHWLLLLLRAAALAILAIAAAEPISRATGGWLGAEQSVATIVLDNSLSMAAKAQPGRSRLGVAKAEATSLLSADDRPALAAVITTAEAAQVGELTGELDALRNRISKVGICYGRTHLVSSLASAIEAVERESAPRRNVYLFGDLQLGDFDQLADLETKQRDVHLFIIDTSGRGSDNVGIEKLEIAGQPIVGQVVSITASLVNSSSTARKVDVLLRVNERLAGRRIAVALARSGQPDSVRTVRFDHRFEEPGYVHGEVVLSESDDLAADNIRRFAVDVSGAVQVLVVRPTLAVDSLAADPAVMLEYALDPYGDESRPWSISSRVISVGEFDGSVLAGMDAVFFCEIPTFTPTQAGAIERFTRRGGTTVLFLGEDVQPGNYNSTFTHDGGERFLPARIGRPIGQVGPAAPVTPIGWVDVDHPYLKDLYEDPADYLTVLVQRHFVLDSVAAGDEVLVRLESGHPLVLSKSFGRGRVVLSAVPTSMQWSNLPATGLFLPMIDRISRLGRKADERSLDHLAGTTITIRPGDKFSTSASSVQVSLPVEKDGRRRRVQVPLAESDQGPSARFTETLGPGLYRWQLSPNGESPDDSGLFVVNALGNESRLESIDSNQLAALLRQKGLKNVYIGDSVAAVHASAVADGRGRNWWDVLLVAVLLLVVAETFVANLRRGGESAALPGRSSGSA